MLCGKLPTTISPKHKYLKSPFDYSLWGKAFQSNEIAEIVSINPLIPQDLGDFKAGGRPKTPGRKYPAPLFKRSLCHSELVSESQG
jgi:hypothetical protein